MNHYKEFLSVLNQKGIAFESNVLLNAYTSFRIGGPCDVMVYPVGVEQTRESILACLQFDLPYFILGKGTNLLVDDAGYRGVILSTESLQELYLSKDGTICAGAGVPLSSVCRFALEHSLTGLEFAFGIPGSVGGAAYMNAGAYGGEMKDIVTCCEHITSQGVVQRFCTEDLHYSYRTSVYAENDYCITNVYLSLKHGDYHEIETRMNELLQRRKDKQPLSYPSAGSTFKRPVGGYASALIEECGLKGKMIGGAQVSEKHSGFVINTGDASCGDVEALIREIQRVVLEQKGITLHCEVKKLASL